MNDDESSLPPGPFASPDLLPEEPLLPSVSLPPLEAHTPESQQAQLDERRTDEGVTDVGADSGVRPLTVGGEGAGVKPLTVDMQGLRVGRVEFAPEPSSEALHLPGPTGGSLPAAPPTPLRRRPQGDVTCVVCFDAIHESEGAITHDYDVRVDMSKSPNRFLRPEALAHEMVCRQLERGSLSFWQDDPCGEMGPQGAYLVVPREQILEVRIYQKGDDDDDNGPDEGEEE